MSAPLFDDAAPDVTDFLITWLLPLGDTWAKRPKQDSATPYRIVNRVSAVGDGNQFTDDSVVSVHSIGSTYAEAKACAAETDRRIDLLARSLNTVVMPNGRYAAPDFVETVQKPIHVDYGDTALERFVARYRVIFSYVAA